VTSWLLPLLLLALLDFLSFAQAIQELDSLGMVASRQVPLSESNELKRSREMKWRLLEQQQ
jgi:hypothetical protein